MANHTLTVSYRLSAKVNPADKDSAWHSAEVSYGEETDGTDVNMDQLTTFYMEVAKQQVLSQLGLQWTEDENGVLQPVFPIKSIPTKSTARRDEVAHPTSITLDGTVYYDYRNSTQKATNPRFPDFKTEDGKGAFWLQDKDGSKSEFAKRLEEAGKL